MDQSEEEVEIAAHRVAEEIRPLIEELMQLQEMQVRMLAPEVSRIIRDRVTDTNVIGLTLDRLFDCAGTPSGLQEFKKLCRYYWTIDPAATAWYINEYHDWYDSPDEEDDFSEQAKSIE